MNKYIQYIPHDGIKVGMIILIESGNNLCIMEAIQIKGTACILSNLDHR